MCWQDRLIEAIGRKNIFSLDINPVNIKKKKRELLQHKKKKNTITAVTGDLYGTACQSHPDSLRNSPTTHILSCRWLSCFPNGRNLWTVGINQHLTFWTSLKIFSHRFVHKKYWIYFNTTNNFKIRSTASIRNIIKDTVSEASLPTYNSQPPDLF